MISETHEFIEDSKIEEAGRRRYNVKCTKIEPDSRDTYGEYAAGYLEQHGGDDGWSVPVGGEARYSVALTDEGFEAFTRASNLLDIEEAAIDEAFGPIENGVDRDQRVMNRTRGLSKGRITPLLMVADTGDTSNAYVANRRLARWTWFGDDGMGRNSHGPWCLGSATAPEPGKFVISAKVLGDNGSGPNSHGIAALYQFARLCRDRKVPGVASLSLGSNSSSNAYRDAIAFCASVNVAVIAAAGNQSRRNGISFPAAYCTSVGAHDRNYAAASFSNRNAAHTLPDSYALGVSVNGIGGVKSGSSMATPATAMAVWYAMSRGMRSGVVRNAARSHNAGNGRVLDGGRLMALAPKDDAPVTEPPVTEPPVTEPPVTEPPPGGERLDALYRVFAPDQKGAFAQKTGAIALTGKLLDERNEVTIRKGPR
jgi:hypothetical protein